MNIIMKVKVAILGTTGMLGHEVAKVISSSIEDVLCIDRSMLDAEHCQPDELRRLLAGFDWVINCIGIIKPYIHNNNSFEVKRAVMVNAVFPHILAQSVEKGTKIIQIATDCVFSGKKGMYTESSEHDAIDIYGKTKSLGEVQQNGFINLRCSIIGREIKNKLSLLEWFLNQPKNSKVNGFLNHLWNGITTLAFAKICLGIIRNNTSDIATQHVVPANVLSKSKMLEVFGELFGRRDILVKSVHTAESINRTLSTLNPQTNSVLWRCAGYGTAPTLEELIKELSHEK